MREPDFIIAGVAKAGTTSLYRYLGEHPEIALSEKKELNYFAYDDERIHREWPHLPFPATTWQQYLSFFGSAQDASIVGEASPIYFESELAPRAIYERLPRAKIIISLRDPVERAFSGYLMHVRDGAPELSDAQIVASQQRFITGGYYADKLQRFLEHFPREQIRVILFDDLRTEPLVVMKALYSFLGAKNTDFEPATGKHHNKGSYPRLHKLNAMLKSDLVRHRLSPLMPAWVRRAGHRLLRANSRAAPAMSTALKQELRALYREDILRVADIIDRDLDRWTQAG